MSKGQVCAICQSKLAPGLRTFCSARCRDIDLGRWLTGSYVVPGRPLADSDEESEGTAERIAAPDSPPEA